MLPNKRLQWRDVLVGSFGTALLFEAGQTVIGYYLANLITANIYGAAGGIIVLLIWVYYSAQIFLLGAEFTKVWAEPLWQPAPQGMKPRVPFHHLAQFPVSSVLEPSRSPCPISISTSTNTAP